MHRFAQCLYLGLFVSSSAAYAFQPLITDDTGTQGSDGNQIEFSLNHDRTTVGGDVVRTATFPAVFTRGLTDTLDLFAGASHVRIRPNAPGTATSGGGNPVLGVKWRFYENTASQTSLALKPELALPVSRSGEASGLGTGRLSYGMTLILTQELPFGAIHANLGGDRNRYRDTAASPNASVLRASLAPVWDVAERWKLALDLGLQRERAGGPSRRIAYAEVGAVYSPTKDLDFALGIVRQSDTADPKSASTQATTGVTWRFK